MRLGLGPLPHQQEGASLYAHFGKTKSIRNKGTIAPVSKPVRPDSRHVADNAPYLSVFQQEWRRDPDRWKVHHFVHGERLLIDESAKLEDMRNLARRISRFLESDLVDNSSSPQ